MLLAGDEFARTQNGNNNAYCQDNEISWVNWDVNEKGQFLIHFAQHLTRLRHRYSILRRSRFLTGEYNEELGIKDVTWINASGVAFYALLANFPGIAALISIYGLFADPASVANHLTRLRT